MKKIHFPTINICLMIIVLLSQSTHASDKQSNVNMSYEKILHDKQERTYYLHLPPNHSSTSRLPVMLVLHGGGKADGDKTAKYTGYNELADRHGFIVAYPNGLDAQWNDGRGKTFRKSNNSRTDDVGFISVLIDKIILDYKGDSSRVYVTGLSNGGMMTLRLGCELSSKLAAIAPVIANIPKNIVNTCSPDSPLPILLMNGTHDPLVPWNGGHVRFFRRKMGKVVSTPETVNFWVTHNKCSPTPDIRTLPDTDKSDHSRVKVTTYSNATNTSEVILYTIMEGGHTFPGSNSPDLPRILGRKNNDIVGSAVIWKFFSRHSIKKAQSSVELLNLWKQ